MCVLLVHDPCHLSLPVQVDSDEWGAEVRGGLGQSQGEDGVLKTTYGVSSPFSHHWVECVEEHVDVVII